jgi:hypothetical protein
MWPETPPIMATVDVQSQPAEAPGLPDYLLDPNAVLKDSSVNWRYGRAPDYSNTRKVYNESTFFLIHLESSRGSRLLWS